MHDVPELTDVKSPLYLKIASRLSESIEGGLQPGARLPSERELCRRHGVSRVTMRNALASLEEEGRIVSLAARGWFVAAPSSKHHSGVLKSFTEMAAARGLRASCRVLQAGTRGATLDEADALRIAPGAALLELRRVRLLDGLVTAVDRSRLPLAVAPALERVDFGRASLYDVLRGQSPPVVPSSAEYAVEAAPASAEVAELLELDLGAPVLVADQVTYDQTGRRVELGRTTYRWDRYRFHALISATPARHPQVT